MNAIEFIGFGLTFLFTVLLFIRRMQDEKKRLQNPISFEEEEVEEKAPPPPPPPKIVLPAKPKRVLKDDYQFETSIEKYEETVGVQARKLETTAWDVVLPKFSDEISSEDLQSTENVEQEKREASQVKKLFHRLSSPKEMVIFHEVMKEPKGYDGINSYRK